MRELLQHLQFLNLFYDKKNEPNSTESHRGNLSAE